MSRKLQIILPDPVRAQLQWCHGAACDVYAHGATP
jgi:hypothetical protein